jgi:hypothetical protein
LRIVTYNIAADINGVTQPLPGLIAPPGNTNNYLAGGVLEGIGEELSSGNAQPLDILALQETTSNSITVTPIVNGLNTFYGGAGLYSNSTYQATQSGSNTNNAFGNGPNAIVFNARTVQLLASVPVDPPGGVSALGSSSGEYREVMRYQFAPAGVATNEANIFFIYVSHYKSGSGTSVTTARNGEATIIRNNAATLPATARILFVGDFNTGDASEPMYSTLLAPGANRALDPLNPSGSTTTNWDNNSAPLLPAKTDSSTALRYRDDYQMMTTNVYFGSSGGLALMPGTYHVFGNNGTTPYTNSVNSTTNTAFNNRLVTNGPVFISAAQLFLDLASASDHLPVMADYTIPVPAPRITHVSLSGSDLVFTVTNSITNAVYTCLISTNLAAAPTDWTSLASNTATAGIFSLTATNIVSATASQRFFRLQTK